MRVRFTAPLLGMWDAMRVNLIGYTIQAVRTNLTATFAGSPDDIDCFISKHYDLSGLQFVVAPVA